MSGSPPLDHNLCKQMAKCVDELTTSGQNTLDAATMTQVKKICKRSDDYVKHAFHLVMSQLERDHAEIRLGAFLIIQQLFARSHCFRELLLAHFHSFMQLTMETEPNMPMPPPKQVATSLKKMAFDSVQEWRNKFGVAYKKLDLAYNYLKTCKKVAFDDVDARTLAERQREEARSERQQRQREEKLGKVLTEISELEPEIEDCLTQLHNCLQLLLPSPQNFDIVDAPDLRHKDSPSRRHSPSPRHVPRHMVQGGSSAGQDSDDVAQDDAQVGKEGINVEKEGVGVEEVVAGVENDGAVENDVGDVEKVVGDVENDVADVENCGADVEKVNADVEKLAADVEKGNADVENDVADVENDGADVEKDVGDVEKVVADVEKDVDVVEKDVTNVAKQGAGMEKYDTGMRQDEAEVGEFVRQHGLGSLSYAIEVCVNDVELTETDDNVDLLDTLQDAMRLVTGNFLPSTRHWLEAMAKCGGSQEQIIRVLRIKGNLDHATRKVTQLKIRRKTRHPTLGTSHTRSSHEDGEESEDDDFEDVPLKEGYEATVRTYPDQPSSSGRRPWKGSGREEWNLSQLATEEGDPTTGQSSVNARVAGQSSRKPGDSINNKPSTSSSNSSRKNKTMGKVPVVPYGVDLFDWGQDFEVPMISRFDMGHRFWAPPKEEVVDKSALEAKRCRTISFAGQFEPVKWTCRTPLTNGQLCPRMDRFKCPFHGKIIARDEQGTPRNVEDARKIEEEQSGNQDSTPEWEDPELQREIKAATGIDLKRKGKGKGRGKHSNLTDLRESGSSSRKRLESKIFKRDVMKRVAEAMNSVDAKRFKDKFGNNFNYTHSHL